MPPSLHSPHLIEMRALKCLCHLCGIIGVNRTAQGFSVEDTMTDDSYFNISEMKLSITSLYIISDIPKCDIIWTENSDVIDSFISEILK